MSKLPEVDAVYHALSPRARLRTSRENVEDALAALAHVSGVEASSETQSPPEGGEGLANQKAASEGCPCKHSDCATSALQQIADMDPKGLRADDLGRAARVARDALAMPCSVAPIDERLKEHAAARVTAARRELDEALAAQKAIVGTDAVKQRSSDSMGKLISALEFVIRHSDSLTPSDIQRMQAILAEVGDMQ